MMFGGDMANELAQVGQFCPNERCELYGETAGLVLALRGLGGAAVGGWTNHTSPTFWPVVSPGWSVLRFFPAVRVMASGLNT